MHRLAGMRRVDRAVTIMRLGGGGAGRSLSARRSPLVPVRHASHLRGGTSAGAAVHGAAPARRGNWVLLHIGNCRRSFAATAGGPTSGSGDDGEGSDEEGDEGEDAQEIIMPTDGNSKGITPVGPGERAPRPHHVIALPLRRRPLFPGFILPLTITDEKLMESLVQLKKVRRSACPGARAASP